MLYIEFAAGVSDYTSWRYWSKILRIETSIKPKEIGINEWMLDQYRCNIKVNSDGLAGVLIPEEQLTLLLLKYPN